MTAAPAVKADEDNPAASVPIGVRDATGARAGDGEGLG